MTVKELQEVREYYKNREDKLESRTHIIATGQIIENFMPGRLLSLRGNSINDFPLIIVSFRTNQL